MRGVSFDQNFLAEELRLDLSESTLLMQIAPFVSTRVRPLRSWSQIL
jgi:hypothetical protein